MQIFIGIIVLGFLGLFVMMSVPMRESNTQDGHEI